MVALGADVQIRMAGVEPPIEECALDADMESIKSLKNAIHHVALSSNLRENYQYERLIQPTWQEEWLPCHCRAGLHANLKTPRQGLGSEVFEAIARANFSSFYLRRGRIGEH